MTMLASIPDKALLERMPRLVRIERDCTADVIAYLAEIDRRRLYLDAACRSLSCYCVERLGFSEDEAAKRVRVARVARRFPDMLDALRAGDIHLTGLWLLAPLLTEANASALLAEARGKTRREIEELIARRFPKPDVPPRICPESQQQALPTANGPSPVRPASAPSEHDAKPAKVKPLSEARWSVQLSIGAELKAKIDEAQRLLSHTLPSGDLAALLDRALDALLVQEKKLRFGAGKPRKRRPLKPDSRHVPVDLVREITERDGGRCTFVDEHGNRCTAREHLTIEHRNPYAKQGPTSPENLCLLCMAHNLHAARKVFGEAQVDEKITEKEFERTRTALCNMGFRDADVRKTLASLRQTSRAARAKELIVEALAMLVPPTTLEVRDSRLPQWRSSATSAWPGPGMTIQMMALDSANPTRGCEYSIARGRASPRAAIM